MARAGGGRELEGGLEKLKFALLDYLGLLNEQSKGLTVELPEKPEAMMLWEQCEVLGTGLYDGGAIDQPVVFMQEVAVIKQTTMLFAGINNG